MKTREMAKLAYNALEEKKAEDITVIDIRELSSLGDYFILGSGTNRNQVQAMSDNVEEYMFKAGHKLKNREGYSSGGWILLDYYDIIIHIFSEEERGFYNLEKIWNDGKVIKGEEL